MSADNRTDGRFMYGIPQMFWEQTRHEAVGVAARVGRTHPTKPAEYWTAQVVPFDRQRGEA